MASAARNRPPGITIFPALLRCRDSPAALRSLFVRRRGVEPGGGEGDGEGEDTGLKEAVSDRDGVSASSASATASASTSPSPSPLSSSTSISASISTSASRRDMGPRAVPRRVRFGALILVADTSDDPDDSSNERFGERRYSRSCAYKPGGNDGNAGGDADRELGRGISAGVGSGASATAGTTVDEDADCRCALELRRGRESGFGAETGTGASLLAEAEPARARALPGGLEDCLGTDGRSCGTESAESSRTFGGPEWGPRRLRIDEKCSQSW